MYPKKFQIDFQNGSNHLMDHFIVKERAEESKVQSTCLEENTEKYIIFLNVLHLLKKKWKELIKKKRNHKN